MIIQTIKFKSQFPKEEVLIIAKERESQFRAINGLIQKYYIQPKEEGCYGGVYIWDSMESLNAYRTSELAASIPKAYGVLGKPTIEIVDLLFQLRE